MKLDEKFRALAEIVSVVNSYKLQIQENEKEIEISRMQLNESVQAGADLTNFRAFDAYMKRLYVEIENYFVEIEKQNSALNQARIEVNEAIKQVRIIEILKEKKIKEFNDMVSKVERNETEEFNTISALRRKPNGDNKDKFFGFVGSATEESDDHEREFTKKESSELQKLYNRFA